MQPSDTQFINSGAVLTPTFDLALWVPTLTFAVPGDLVVAYTQRLGNVSRIGDRAFLDFGITTSNFTFTTASGVLQITGAPIIAGGQGIQSEGGAAFSGITKAGFTQFSWYMTFAGSIIQAKASGSGVAIGDINAADMPSGGSVVLRGTLIVKV